MSVFPERDHKFTCPGRRALKAVLAMLAGLMLLAMPQTAMQAGAADSLHIQIDPRDGGYISETVRLGLNKSLIVDLPRPAKDVLVSNPKKADAVMRTPNRAYVIGMEVGQTNVFFFDARGNQILSLELQVEKDLAALTNMYRRLFPGESISVDIINENIVLTGSVSNSSVAGRAADIAGRFAGDAEKVLNMLATAGKEQVLLKVTVAEMQRSAVKQFGVNLNHVLQHGNTTFNVISDNPFSLTGSALSNTLLSATRTSGANTLSGVLRALEQSGLLRTLAEPTLTAVSGESASFLAGGEFPVPVGSDDNGITIEFKPFGVGLAFTPVVLSEGRISMKINTEVSETTSDGAFSIASGSSSTSLTIPALKVRRADTTVELPSGGSLVIAGLIQESTKHNIDGVPGVKDLPVLGALFRSRDFQNDETELVVIVTPYIAAPTSRDKLSIPGEGFRTPPDLEATLLGRFNEIYGARGGARPTGSYAGNPGFIVK